MKKIKISALSLAIIGVVFGFVFPPLGAIFLVIAVVRGIVEFKKLNELNVKGKWKPILAIVIGSTFIISLSTSVYMIYLN